jgi:hypothetical protein
MQKIKVKISNCYGINDLDEDFDFSEKKSTYAIYAPNGVMKTSFSNIFDDFANNRESRDMIFKEKEPTRIITTNEGEPIDKNSVFVIKPYDKNYKSNKISTLLAKDELRREYDQIHELINESKSRLISDMTQLSKLKSGVDEAISEAFMGEKNNFFKALQRVKDEVVNYTGYDFSDIEYSVVFDPIIISFLETKDFKIQIRNYIEKYDQLLSHSAYLKQGFNHYNATTVHKSLKDQGFFKANHSINLANTTENKIEVKSEKELIDLIKDEKERIMNDPGLKAIFEAIDKKISNAQLREFREYLLNHKDILSELENLNVFRQKIWISYLRLSKDEYIKLLSEYEAGHEKIRQIIEKAKAEATEWENVIDIFNRRFFVPFKLSTKNKEDTILKNLAPTIHYFFQNREESVSDDLLLQVLSQGERRALYLLNIIFEIESRKKMNLKTLLVIDDIADSFDYKNKYAIVEYLKEISDDRTFNLIILTHNFDFFRTVQERIGMSKWDRSYIAIRDNEKISLENLKYSYISNPFQDWKGDLRNQVKLISSITFTRNIAEYTGDTENFKRLTSVLHVKSDTRSITISDINEIYKVIYKDLTELQLDNLERPIYGLIMELAESISADATERGLNLENKILLSIAIRLKAEEFMIEKINEPAFVSAITKYQTGKLFGKYKSKFGEADANVEILERVSIMTPENIHLNSFMFEPILDMSDYHLKKLFQDVKGMA